MKEHWGEIIKTQGDKEKTTGRWNNIGQMKMHLRDLQGIDMISTQCFSLISKEITKDYPMWHHKGH